MTNLRSPNDPRGLSRRGFLGASAGALMFAMMPMTPAVAAVTGGKGGRLIPDGKVGTILYTQRDAVSRAGARTATPTLGHVGPADMDGPDDRGPLVPLPGGFLEVFEFLAAVGVKQVEFAGFGQHASNVGGPAPSLGNNTSEAGRATFYANRSAYLDYIRTLRSFLDATGLEAIGSHGYVPASWDGPGSPSVAGSPAGTMNAWERDRFLVELEAAAILGMPYTGTGGDPTNANNRNVEAWELAAQKWLALNALASATGVALYPHNHSPAYGFLQDGPMVTVTQDRLTGAPIAPTQVRGESGTRLMEHYLANTDASCPIELDVYWAHVAQHQHRWHYDHEGVRRERVFDPTGFTAANTKRIPLYHAKDGESTGAAPGVGNGYDFAPFGAGDIDFRSFLGGQGAKGFHNPNYEQDNAPGGGADPGRSLRYTRYSVANMKALRG